MSITKPTPPWNMDLRAPRTLRARWRFFMILGMNSIALIIAVSASLILLLEQRQAVIRLQESTARQTEAAAQTALTALQAEGAGIADADPQTIWGGAVAVEMGSGGYVYIVDESGAILAHGPDLDVTRDPAGFDIVKDARAGHPAVRVFKGITGDWVIGRAQVGNGYTIITESPLSEFGATVARVIALWLMAFVITALIGELLVRRIVRTVLGPLNRLYEGARAVEGGDYGYRIRLASTNERELHDLAGAFNEMIAQLQSSQRQIDAYTNEMQEIVDQRARELARKAMQLEVAADVSHKIATILEPRALVREVVDLIRARFEVYHVEILLVDADTGVISPGPGARRGYINLSLHDSESSVVAWVARHGETLYVPDINRDDRYRPMPDLPASRCELAIPLRFGENVIGVLNLEAAHAHAFPRDEIAVLESLANEIAVSLHNAQIFDALENANRDLAQATMEATQANSLKARFLFNASHKLRTPLNAIIGYSETTLSGVYGDLPQTLLDRQQRILENGRMLQALVEDMLDLSALETGQMNLNFGWFDPVPLLYEVLNAARALHQTGYAAHDLSIRLELPPFANSGDHVLPPIWADVDRLRYVLINLLSNAIKFTESGEVVMCAEADTECVLIHVRDTGIGIHADEQSYLFQPFQHQQGATGESGKGTGLGLPVAHLLALRHGGSLAVESTPQVGSRFTLCLPRRPAGAPPPPE